MTWKNWISVFVLIVFAGCSASNSNRDAEARASYHLRLADSLGQAMAFAEAAQEYAVVAEHYPGTRYHANAMLEVALLSLNPANEAASDSIAVYWFQEYLKLPRSAGEREGVQVYLRLLERIQGLQNSLVRKKAVQDSLIAVTKKQGEEIFSLASRSKQIQNLEGELKKANEELAKLREVDVRVSKGREKK